MKYRKLLENLDSRISEVVADRRYNLSEIISESYNLYYQSREGSHMQKLAEAHLNDLRRNPSDAERLSTQLCNLKHLKKMIESKKMKDEELLVPEESFDTVEPKEKDLQESAQNEELADELEEAAHTYSVFPTKDGEHFAPIKIKARDEKEAVEKAKKQNRKYRDYEWECELIESSLEDEDLLEDTDLTDEEVEELTKHLAEIRKNKKVSESASEVDTEEVGTEEDESCNEASSYDEAENIGRGLCAPIMNNMIEYAESLIASAEKHGDDPRVAAVVKSNFQDLISRLNDIEAEIGEFDAYWASHKAAMLANIEGAKELIPAEFKESKEVTPDEEVKESKGRKLKRKVTEAAEKFVYHVDFEDGMSVPFDTDKEAISYAKRKNAKSVAKTPVRVASNTGEEHLDGDNEEIIWTNESKSWSDLKEGMKNFNANSSSKAFYKTFKKMYEALKEGKALTRQESINLYKAANSAMTQLSVELEHNPGFLSTFSECTALLSEDVARLLESTKNGKAPSKANMKSLAKFAEALLCEADEDGDEELPPIEDEEDAVISDEEGGEEATEVSEESEEFDQEYADARVELHKELADKFADSEDPEVQEKLAQDTAEVVDLPGITDEQLADIVEDEADTEESGESNEDEAEEDVDEMSPAVAGALAGAAGSVAKRVNSVGFEGPKFNATFNEDSSEDDSEITDDELAELKKHLQEMRRAKKG